MIESSDLTSIILDGLPLGTFLVKARLDMLTNHLLPEGCKDRTEFEKDYETFFQSVSEGIEASKMKAQLEGKLQVPAEQAGTGLYVPGQ